MARATRGPRPPVSAMFISKPDRLEVGPGDNFEVGKVYQMSPRSLDRWVNLGRARLATDEEIAAGRVNAAPAVEFVVGDFGGAGGSGSSQPPPSGGAGNAESTPSPAVALLARLETDPAMKNFMAFRSEAQKILGEATPQKKADIIEALKAKAAA